MKDAILVLNAGSSSIKFALYPTVAVSHGLDADNQAPLIRGKITGIGNQPTVAAQDQTGNPIIQSRLMQIAPNAGYDDLIPNLLNWLESGVDDATICAAGHRVVHGGQEHDKPARVSPALMTDLEKLIALAPLHQPHNLAAIRAVATALPELAQVACFDTSFHRTQIKLTQCFALPRALTDEGIIRYGFHGLSYDYIAGQLPKHLGARANGRVIVAHLGNGASMCAMKNRQSVATSMGFTALDGLMMGRRCGTIDPGVILHLIDHKGMSSQEVSQVLYNQSGLLGVSGISNDMHVLETSNNPHAQEAINLFCYRAACELASLTIPIGGIDTIVFTAGIGENSADVRQKICEHLSWMGVFLDDGANTKNATRISKAGSDVDVLIIPTNEEIVIARATYDLTNSRPRADR